MATQLICTNKKVCEFYKKNKNIDFENVNLFFVQLFENILENSGNSESINKQILEKCLANQESLDSLHKQLEYVKTNLLEINNNFTLKMQEVKKDYLENVRTIISNDATQKIADIVEKANSSLSDKTMLTLNHSEDKISNTLEKSLSTLVDKTKLLFSEIVPENLKTINSKIDNDFYKFSNSISQELQKMVENGREHDKYLIDILQKNTEKNQAIQEIAEYITNKKNNDVEQFMENFENKFSNLFISLQQPLLSGLDKTNAKMDSDMQSLLSNMSTSQCKMDTTMEKIAGASENMQQYLDKYRNSSQKGAICEKRLRIVLNKMFNTAEIIDTSSAKESGDCILRRDGKDEILFETKEYEANINPEEIKKFIRDCTIQDSHGIFISQISGITSKNNYQIEINKGKVLVYIHFGEYMADKIAPAVEIVDILSDKLKEIFETESEDNEIISKEILDEINIEFQQFFAQKQNIITTVKDFEKKLLQQLNDLSFPKLEEYLCKRFASVKQSFVCDICGKYEAKTNKSLSAHKRACRKNLQIAE